MTISVHSDTDASFAPKTVNKGQTRFEDFDNKILSIHTRGMTERK